MRTEIYDIYTLKRLCIALKSVQNTADGLFMFLYEKNSDGVDNKDKRSWSRLFCSIFSHNDTEHDNYDDFPF
jgi:hypothetical protein